MNKQILKLTPAQAASLQAFVPFEILESFRTGIDAVLGEGACHVLSIRPQGGVEAMANEK